MGDLLLVTFSLTVEVSLWRMALLSTAPWRVLELMESLVPSSALALGGAEMLSGEVTVSGHCLHSLSGFR